MRSVAVALALVLFGCVGHEASAPQQATLARGITPQRSLGSGTLVPELDEAMTPPKFRRDGAALHLTGGLRIAVHADRSTERALERFAGGVEAVELPSRMGGGFAFFQSDALGTKVWRAARWTGALTPLGSVSRATVELVVGFDRLYLRGRYNDLVALDPEDGKLLPLGPLPLASEHGAMVFADGWRAVVESDFRGPLATFDAGATWRPIEGLSPLRGLVVEGGDPVLFTEEGHVRIGADGSVVRIVNPPDEEILSDEDAPEVHVTTPLGPNPLRLAVERGLPDSSATVLVAGAGKLARVGVPSGRILALDEAAFAEREAECQGVHLDEGLGFVCGTPGGPTVVHRFVPPFGLREVRRFAEPRRVTASGNGNLVVRGRCGGEFLSPRVLLEPSPRSKSGPNAAQAAPPVRPSAEELRRYCVLDARSGEREITVSGEAGSERVVALRDGRTVIVIPPRPGASASLNLVRGNDVTAVPLSIPESPELASNLVRHGLWLEGMWENDDRTLGAWVEAGGRVVGVVVGLDGKVSLGTPYDQAGDVLFSQRFALAVSGEAAFESVDGGRSWSRFVLPRLPDGYDTLTRGCSPAGCVVRGWVRVGWFGKAADGQPVAAVRDELRAAPEVTARVAPLGVRPSLRLACHYRPLAKSAAAAEPTTVAPKVGLPAGASDPALAGWGPFDDVPAPVLAPGEAGIMRGAFPHVPIRGQVYAWGPKAAAWSKAGAWQVRFGDRFAAEGWVRSSARARSPWLDFDAAAEALAARPQVGFAQWQVLVDPSGDAALFSVCRPHDNQCDLLSAAVNEAPRRYPPLAALRRPTEFGAVRLGERWYFLVDGGVASGLELWRADTEGVAFVSRMPRLKGGPNRARNLPSLTRRADGKGLGLLVAMPEDEVDVERSVDWLVYPLDPANGSVGEPIPLDLRSGGHALRRCEPEDEGWLAEVSTAIPTALELVGGAANIDAFEYRLRLDPTGNCIDAISARAARGVFPQSSPGWKPPASKKPIPLTVHEGAGKRRHTFECYAP
jgi:hypothetical protein